jgi:protein-disulfide isomerase
MQEVPTKTHVGLPVALTVLLGLAIVIVVVRLPAGEPKPAAQSAAAVPAAALHARPVRYKLPVTKTQPSLGPVDAPVTVVEWCDLRGPACRTANATMRSLMQSHPGKLRWVHRALLDQANPEASMQAHRLARAAFQHAGKFWEMRDWFLALPDDVTLDEPDYKRAAETIGIDYAMASKAALERSFDPALQIDRAFALKFGVTPPLAYFVNGLSVPLAPGATADSVLRPVIDAELALAESLIASGTAPVDVYNTTIADGAWQAAATASAAEPR